MSAHTTTSTTWGEMRVTYREDRQLEIRSECKRCHRVTGQLVAGDVNPFEVVNPVHLATCPIGQGPKE